MELIRCPRCAREIPDSSRFCRRCGCAIVWRNQTTALVAPVPAAGFPTEPMRQSRPTTTAAGRPKTPPTRRSGGGGGAGVFAIFAAAGLFFFVNYHVAMRPAMAPRPAPVVTPFSPPGVQWRSSAQWRTVPPAPPAPPGTTMWLDEPESASWDAYDRVRHASQHVDPAQPNRRR